MKRLEEMSAVETSEAVEGAFRHQRPEDIAKIIADPSPCPSDDPQLAHAKAAYRQEQCFKRLALQNA